MIKHWRKCDTFIVCHTDLKPLAVLDYSQQKELRGTQRQKKSPIWCSSISRQFSFPTSVHENSSLEISTLLSSSAIIVAVHMDDVNTYFSADRGRDGLFLAITPQKHKTVMPAAGVLDNSGSLTASQSCCICSPAYWNLSILVSKDENQVSSFAGVHVVDSHALLTADVAAPVENAVALLLSLLSPGVVTPAAAEEVTAVYAVGRQVADAIAGAEGAGLGVWVAEIGGALVVNQVTFCGGFEIVVLGSQGLHPPAGLLVFLHYHLWRTVVLILHVVTNDSEVRLRPPARLDLAAAREPVALTLQEHVVIEGLKKKRKCVNQTFSY